ncbi:hypothetical protein [Amaricoccus solimangrovi]|uniref:Uncharacterized protein n=1 Tax=Amaricoccus solimangrovi TaxID=2589815 RepID=A0A501WNN5_9RHOB|nr:hypothetical protein [Amaricoccus solimangrovi]TPE49955.1 hypothetical protein FJM51_13455 [Amaricoccus solimangrovi]
MAFTLPADTPLAERVTRARDARAAVVLNGRSLDELHQLILDTRELERAFTERTIAVADGAARTEREIHAARAWITGTCLAALIILAARAGGLPL